MDCGGFVDCDGFRDICEVNLAKHEELSELETKFEVTEPAVEDNMLDAPPSWFVRKVKPGRSLKQLSDSWATRDEVMSFLVHHGSFKALQQSGVNIDRLFRRVTGKKRRPAAPLPQDWNEEEVFWPKDKDRDDCCVRSSLLVVGMESCNDPCSIAV